MTTLPPQASAVNRRPTAPPTQRGHDQAANLQFRLTVKDAAKLMNVSERSVYTARKIMRLRPDLEPEIMAGRLSLNATLRIAESRAKATSWDRLITAWNNATAADRERFVAEVRRRVESTNTTLGGAA